ncbi:hypothetical protein CI109_103626 [Kwoniella shandongensis]|uniref:Uncharacterized protein n=1 Tax=Kwoniella shandongensis TaxID=1734106 RepID=A0A5M6C924_9TREE|nr:uncharacterized protein CI109_000682 [Kwoniella shandongensis]KAA5531110.1 hypothetical protein CI109_000682 [Kwoniella shandongensis]
MVFINEKKYACEKCIKGHRVSGCTHTDRPLFEVKKKGRPATQCQHCKDKRKASGSSVHTKCACGDPAISNPVQSSLAPDTSVSVPSSAASAVDETEIEVETKKGQPGSRATFPRGLKDVHELAAAANALAGLGDDEGVVQVAERKVQALLNPCKCQAGGPCRCCHPKKSDNQDVSPVSTSRARLGGASLFSDVYWPRAGTSNLDAAVPGDCCSPSTTASPMRSSNAQGLPISPYLSPDNMHHPAHTSPHVHKTKLYSPYSTSGPSTSRHGRRDTSSSVRSSGSATPRSLRPPPTIKPITDIGRLISAAVSQDGTIASEIPRSAVGLPKLPGIQSFDTGTDNGGVKVELTETEDIDMPLAFPTHEEVVIGACACGEECPCPGCATHDNGVLSPGHVHDGSCGEGCKGHHDCANSIPIPSGVTSIAQLISLAAQNVPAPPGTTRMSTLDPYDTRILPPAAQLSEDAAQSLGIVQLKPLECCNGRCQCAPGECTCEKECCGCCVRCACEHDDEDAKMEDNEENPTEATVSSCCSGKETVAADPSPSTAQPALTLSIPSHQPPTLYSSDVTPASSSTSSSRQPSPLPKGRSTPTSASANPNPNLRRTTSTSSKHSAAEHPYLPGPNGRRATVTGQPPAIGVKSTKPIAPRPILPKPQAKSNEHLSASSQSNALPRQSSPVRRTGSLSAGSSSATKRASPITAQMSTRIPVGTKDSEVSNPAEHLLSIEASQAQTQSVPTILDSQSHILQQPFGDAPLQAPIPGPGSFVDQGLENANPEILAFVEQWALSNSQGIDPHTTWSSSQAPLQPSADTSPIIDSSFDLEQFISQTLSSQSQYANQQPQPTAPTHLSESANHQASYQPFYADFFLNLGGESQAGPSRLSSETSAQASRPITPLGSNVIQGEPQIEFTDANSYQSGVIPQWSGHAGYPSLTIGSAVGQHGMSSTGLGPSSAAPPAAAVVEEPAADIIDLSKPLDAAAMAKILKALERQQAKQPGDQPQPQQIQPTMQAQQAQSGSQTQPQATTGLDQQFPSHSFTHTDSTGSAKELDDMFNQFVTLDGVGEGKDTQVGGNGTWASSMAGTAAPDGEWDQSRLWGSFNVQAEGQL